MKIPEKDAYDVLLVKQYDYFSSILKQFLASLEEAV